MPRLQLESATDVIRLDEQESQSKGFQVHSGVIGLGLPDVSTQWLEGAGDGATFRGVRTLPRNIDLPLTLVADDRPALQAMLARLAVMLDGEITLRWIEDDETSWFVKVHRVGGGSYVYGLDTNGETELATILTFRAGDPYWSSEDSRQASVQPAASAGLLGQLSSLNVSSSQAMGTIDLDNPGEVAAFPVWFIEGPGTAFETVSPKGERLRWEGTLLEGESLTIDTGTGQVIDNTGANRYADLATAPRMWKIPPGTSQAEASMQDTSAGRLEPTGSATSTNLIPNPSAEVDAVGWTAEAGTVSRAIDAAAVGSASLKLDASHPAWGYGGTTTTKNAASAPLIDLDALDAPRILWLPGTAGNYVSTPDVNEIDYDSSTFENGVGRWEGLNKNLLTANQSSVETDTTGWLGSGSTVARTTAQALEGTASLSVTRTGTVGNAHAYLATRVPVVPGQVYTALASVRAATTARAAFLVVIWFDAAGSSISGQVQSPDTANHSSGWTQLRVTAQAPSNAVTARIDVQHRDCAVSEVHYVDAVGLFETPNGNLVSNPDFENGIDGWVPQGTTQPTLTHSTSRAYAGRGSMLVTWPTAAGGAAYPQVTVNGLSIGQTYTASAWMYVPAGSTSVSPSLRAVGIVSGNSVSTADTWVRSVVTFVATATSHLLSIAPSFGTTAGQQVYVDAVQVVVGTAPVEYLPPTTTNLAQNPALAEGSGYWGGNGGRVTEAGAPFPSFWRLTASGAYNAPWFPAYLGNAPGVVTVSFWARSTGSGRSWNPQDVANNRTLTGAVLRRLDTGATIAALPQDGAWRRYSVTYTVQATDPASSRFGIKDYAGTDGTGSVLEVTGVQHEHGSVATPYVDGSLGAGYSWDSSENLLSAAASSFEDGTVGGWIQYGGVRENSLDRGFSGTRSLKFTGNGTSAGGTYVDQAVAPSTTYTVSAYVYLPTAMSIRMDVEWPNTTGNIASIFGPVSTTGGWVRLVGTVMAPANAVTLRAVIKQTAADANPFYIDAVQVEQRPFATPYGQTGAAHASTSTRRQPWVLGGTWLDSVTWRSANKDVNVKQVMQPGIQSGAGFTASVTAGQVYTVSAEMIRQSTLRVTAGSAVLATLAVPSSVWTRRTLSFTPPTGVTSVRIESLPGTEPDGSYYKAVQLEKGSAATPYTLPTRITGDIDLRAHVALEDWTPAGFGVLVAKWGNIGDYGYRLGINANGTLALAASVDSTTSNTATSNAAVPASDGQPLHLRVTRIAATGVVRFYTGSDGVTWTQLGGDVGSTPGGVYGSVSTFRFGIDGQNNTGPKGKYLSASVRAGINGTVVAAYDATQHTGTTYTDPQGKVWSISRSGDATAEIVDRNTWAFTGTEYLTLPDRDALDFGAGEALTLCAGAATRSTSATTRTLADKRAPTAAPRWRLYAESGLPRADITDTGSTTATAAGSVADGTFRYIAATRDAAGAVAVVVNGVTATGATARPGTLVSTGALGIGARGTDGGSPYAGHISWVALFRRTLTAAEHTELAAWNGSVATEPIWLRSDAALYVNADDAEQTQRYTATNDVLNLGVVPSVKAAAIPVTAGQSYQLSAVGLTPSGDVRTLGAEWHWLDAGGNLLSVTSGTQVDADGARASVVGVVPAGATQAIPVLTSPYLRPDDELRVDAVFAAQGSSVTDYFDGDSTSSLHSGVFSWTGTPHNSTSQRHGAVIVGRSSITCTWRVRKWMVV